MTENIKGTIAITGASGFVGRKLCQALAESGYKIRVLVRDDKYEEFFKLHRADILTGDLTEKDTAGWLMDGVDGVFHLASILQGAGTPEKDFWDLHYTATKHLLNAAAVSNVKKFVHCSTIGVLGHIEKPLADENSPYNVDDIYQVTKAEGEKLALEMNGVNKMNVTVVRPATVYGPGDMRMLKLFKYVTREKFRMIGNGRTLIHPVYIDDLVDGMIKAYESEKSAGRVYILGGKTPVSLTEWVSLIAEEAGAKWNKFDAPYKLVNLVAIACEAVCKPLGIEPPLYQRRVDFFIKNRAFSIERAKEELEYEPKVDLREGTRRSIAWYSEQNLL